MSWHLIQNAERRLAAETALLRPASGGDVRVALGYPNTYFVGMSNLGMQAVYAMLNGTPGVTCERFFLPDPEQLREYRDCGRQLFTLESQRPVGDFDLVAFSVSYENDYPHLALMLDLAGLPIFSEERTADQPLVLVGGAITLLNPEPLADFVDLFALGEAEGLVGPLIESLRRGAQRDRRARLEALAQLSGFYVPSLYEPRYQDGRFAGLVATPGAPPRLEPCHRTPAAFQESPAYSQILTPDTEFGRSGLVEVSRGCPYLCRFCTVGFSYPRVRWQPVDRLWQVVENLLESTDRVGLISASVGNHPQIDDLCQRLLDRGGSVSFSSLRADRLPDSLLEALVRGGAQTLTLAPEVGSDRLRRAINKRFTGDEYLDAACRVFRKGVRNLRMYSMIGLPEEEDEHVEALVELVRRTRRIQCEEGRSGGRITLSMGQFVPKPATPFQWEAMASRQMVSARMKKVERALGGEGGVQVHAESPRWALLQGLLARGDRRFARVIASVFRNPSFRAWMQALEEEGIDVAREAFTPRDSAWPLPWGHLASPWSVDLLLKDRARAARIASHPCPTTSRPLSLRVDRPVT